MRCELLCFYLEWAPNWNSVPRSCQYIKSAYCGALKRPEKNEWSCAARHPRIFWIMRPYNVPNNNPSSQWAGNNINEFYCRFEKPFHRLHLNRSPPLFCTTFPSRSDDQWGWGVSGLHKREPRRGVSVLPSGWPVHLQNSSVKLMPNSIPPKVIKSGRFQLLVPECTCTGIQYFLTESFRSSVFCTLFYIFHCLVKPGL